MSEGGAALHLDSMRRAADRAMQVVARVSYDEFAGDPDAQAAAAMYLILVGEAANRIAQLSPEPERYAVLPLQQMRGLRNRIVHDYETLHLPTIWATVRDALPLLVAQIDKLVESGHSPT